METFYGDEIKVWKGVIDVFYITVIIGDEKKDD